MSNLGTAIKEYSGHDGSVQDLVFDPLGKFIVSCGADCSFKLWS